MLASLENMLIMMIESLSKSGSELEQSNILLDLEREINCFCNKCLIARTAKSDKSLIRPDSLKEESAAYSLKEIQ